MLDGEELDAPAGTLVHCPAATLRGAVAVEPGTTVLGIGAKPGEVFEPSGGSGVRLHVAAQPGHEKAARAEFEEGFEAYPDTWRATTTSPARRLASGTTTTALAQLRRAAEIDQGVVSKYAPGTRTSPR